MPTTEYGDISPRSAGKIARKLLKRGQYMVMLERFGQVDPQPKKATKVRKYRRYESLQKAVAPLAEGITPTGQKLTYTDIDTQTGLSAGKNGQINFSYARPSGATAMKFTLAGPNGDADLYVKRGSAPTTASYDCRSAGATSNEGCTITNAASGTYYVMIYAYAAYTGLTFQASSGQ